MREKMKKRTSLKQISFVFLSNTINVDHFGYYTTLYIR